MAVLTKDGMVMTVPDSVVAGYLKQGWSVPGAPKPVPAKRKRATRPRKSKSE